jgi:Transposase
VRLLEVVHGKSGDDLPPALDHIPGRENVQWVALDMSDGYRSFARSFFPNAGANAYCVNGSWYTPDQVMNRGVSSQDITNNT